MDIRTYNKEQLGKLIHSEYFKNMPVVPISTHRAISHINNPRASVDDVLMIIAFENDVMIGYLGVLPDFVYDNESKPHKCGWLSCMWVNPTLRGKGIAKQLLANAFKTWDDKIFVTEFTPEAKGLYDRSGNFTHLQIREGLRCYRRFNLHEVLPKKNEQYKPFSKLLQTADAIANIPIDILHSVKSNKINSLHFELVTEINEELGKYIQAQQNSSFEKRGRDELNWILQYPWLTESNATEESSKYHFSSVADRFQNVCFKIIWENSIKGYIHFTIRDNHLKIPYAFFETELTHKILNFTYGIMAAHKLNMLTVFHPPIVSYLKKHSTPFIYKRPVKRHYIITRKLSEYFAQNNIPSILDGDADCAFT